MTHGRVRRVWALGLGIVAVPVLVASIAYACTSLATLNVQSAGLQGDVISGTGKGFSTSELASPVEVRFGSRSGTVLWAGRPNASGELAFSFQVPDVSAGQYAIIATQSNANGTPVGGTPARAAFEVTGAPAPAAAPVQAAPAETTATPAPAATSAPAPAAAPRVVAPAPARVVAPAPARAVAPAPARAVAPAPARAVTAAPVATPAPVAAPAPVATPAPAVTPAPEVPAAVTPAPVSEAPAPAAATPAPEARRSVMVSMADGSDGSPWLAIGLVGLGLVLALGATALVIAGRREGKAPAAARR